jgi:hypothetical protein
LEIQRSSSDSSFSESGTANFGGTPLSISDSGVGPSTFWSKTIVVGNVDVQAGFGYWITPNLKLAASYRLDAFFGALKQNPDSDPNVPEQSIDRFYHGPRLTLTGRF